MTIIKQSTPFWERADDGGICVRSRELNCCKIIDIGLVGKLMTRLKLGFPLVLSAMPAFAAGPVTVTQLPATHTAASGQPIVLPQHDVQLVVSRFVLVIDQVEAGHSNTLLRDVR